MDIGSLIGAFGLLFVGFVIILPIVLLSKNSLLAKRVGVLEAQVKILSRNLAELISGKSITSDLEEIPEEEQRVEEKRVEEKAAKEMPEPEIAEVKVPETKIPVMETPAEKQVEEPLEITPSPAKERDEKIASADEPAEESADQPVEELVEITETVEPAAGEIPEPAAVERDTQAALEEASIKQNEVMAFQAPKPEIKVPVEKTGADQRVSPGDIQVEKSELWLRLEKQFMDNWTGILGAVIMVMGAAFLSIYAALRMAPVYRFMMLTAFSTVLFVIYFLLRAKSKWLKLAVWLRSSGCAVFLFGCLGSGGIPGLKWIHSFVPALLLLLLGITVNLVVGVLSGSQFFASFHGVLSLVALSVAPQSQLTLILAVAISLLGIIQTYKTRWEYHLLVTITAFLAYHIYWVFTLDLLNLKPMPPNLRLAGIAATAVIGVATALIHYRKGYLSVGFNPLSFLVHLLNWAYMAAGFMVYSTGSKWKTIVLMTGALIIFMLSRRAKKQGIRWLYITDTLVAQSVALLAVFTLGRWEMTGMPIIAVSLLEVIVFLTVMLREEEQVLQRIGIYLFHLSGIGIMLMAIAGRVLDEASSMTRDATVLAVVLAIYFAFHFYLFRRYGEKLDSAEAYGADENENTVSFSGVILGLITIVLFSLIYTYQWSGYAVSAIVAAFLLIGKKFEMRGLGIGAQWAAVAITMGAWGHLRSNLLEGGTEAIIFGLPFLALALAGMLACSTSEPAKACKAPWLYLFSLHLGIYSYTILQPISPLLVGTVWLLLAPVYWETGLWVARRRERRLEAGGNGESQSQMDRFLLQIGYIFLVLFIGRHLSVHFQAEAYLFGYKVRLLQEFLALGVFLYWALGRKPEKSPDYLSWKFLHPLMWELFLGFVIMMTALEIADAWHPVAWVVMAFCLLAIGSVKGLSISRFRFYALLMYWAAAFHIAFISTSDAMPSLSITHQAWFGGLMAILLQLGFVIVFYRGTFLEGIQLPAPVSSFSQWIQTIREKPHLWIYYPFFLAVSLFLYWTFDKSLLTFLWVVEAFAIFGLSIFLKENHFRHLAMVGLGGCLVRLLIYDLAQSGTVTRALVFLGVGIIMLLMHSLYNKYRERFKDE